MKKRYEQNLKVHEAMWLYLDNRPCLGLLYGLDVLYIDHTISKNLLSLGLVYLGDTWKDKIPPINVMGLELKGFARDVTLNLMIKQFIAAVEGNHFSERKITPPHYRTIDQLNQ